MKYAVLLVALMIGSNSWSQEFGGNPSKVKWRQINNDTLRIIFPAGMERKAQRIAGVVAAIQTIDHSSLGENRRKINLVLQNGKTISNAYVGLAPWRTEFYTTPPQDPFELGAINWLDNLAIHEFRHVHQYSNFNKGFSKFASVILGEQGQDLANVAAIPDWFFEGDAVYNETRFSPQGRGKLPLFLSSYQSLFQAGKQYSYMQLRNGSYRKYLPDHYDLGYLLVSYGRKQYGDDIWKKVTGDAAAYKPFFYPFQNALKAHTRISFNRFVSDAMHYYQSQWPGAKGGEANWVTKTIPNDVIDYRYPYTTADGSILVLKKSYKHIPAFYLVGKDGKEAKIATRSIAMDDYYSYNNGKIIYAAYQPDARWGNREFNQLNVLDLASGEEHTIVRNSKYYSPDISHDGSGIVAVELDPITGAALVVLDKEGKKISTTSKAGCVFASPKFSANDKWLYFTLRNERGEMGLFKKGLASSDTLQTLLPFSNSIIGYLSIQGDTLIFSTTHQGRDEIWSYVNAAQKNNTYRLASYSTGLYQGVLQPNGQLVASAFTAEGYRLAAFRPLWQQVVFADALFDLYADSVYRKTDHNLLTNIGNREITVSKYPKSKGLLNLHSWRPAYSQPEYSFTIYGDNVLNTLHSEIAYTYNQNEGSHKLGYGGVYGGSYLQPVFGINQTWSRSALYRVDTVFNWNELNAYVGLQLPLNLSGGKSYRYLTLSSTYNIEQVRWTGIGQKLLRNLDFNSVETRLYYVSQIQKAKQQIFPHWGQSLLAQYKTQTGNYAAHQLLLSGNLYLPGFSNNHSIVVSGAFQSRDTLQQYVFTNNFPFSRGYTAIDFPRMWKIGANYHVPLCYPEWGFGNLVYLLRLRMNAFYDFTRGKSLRTGNTYDFATAGAELFFDTRWWNQQPVSFGIRYSHLLNNEFRGITQPNVWEFILPVNLF